MIKLDAPINEDKVLDFAIQRLFDIFDLKNVEWQANGIGRISALMTDPSNRRYLILCRNYLCQFKKSDLNKSVVDKAAEKGWELVVYVKDCDSAYRINPKTVQQKYKEKVGWFNQQETYKLVDFDLVLAENLEPTRRKRINKPEKFLTSLFVQYNLPLFYVGDNSQGIEIVGKRPDWINGDKTKVVDYCGIYWHTPEEIEEREKLFHKEGFDYLIIWEGEEKDISKL